MAKQKKIKVNKELGTFGIYQFEGTLDGAIALLESYKELEYDSFSIEVDIEQEHYSDSYRFIIYGHRLETDEEYNARMEKNKAARKAAAEKRKLEKLKKEQAEKAEYERLKKKFKDD